MGDLDVDTASGLSDAQARARLAEYVARRQLREPEAHDAAQMALMKIFARANEFDGAGFSRSLRERSAHGSQHTESRLVAPSPWIPSRSPKPCV
jgi:hypothetical protein